jgi:RNA polymerase sigma-70 factor (ECF subfamily)
MLKTADIEDIYAHLISSKVADRKHALNKLYEVFQPMLFAKLRSKYQKLSENEAQDIVQNAFISIWQTKALPKDVKAFPKWVIRVIENEATDLFRKAYKSKELPIENDNENDEEYNVIERKEYDSITFQESDINRNVEDCVSRKIQIFSNKYPDNGLAISMQLDDIAIKEIALIFDKTADAMKQYIADSKKKLAPFLRPCLEL